MNSLSLEEDSLFSWLAALLDRERFDVIVTVERKATAILRALLDLLPERSCEWDWGRVLSSEAIPYLAERHLSGQRILVFNEMIHRGQSTKDALAAIRENTRGEEKGIETAAYAVHEEFARRGCWRTQDFRDDPAAQSPDHAVKRDVSAALYGVIRERLIQSLRSKGALLLDTEHPESTFRLTMPVRRFLEGLRRLGAPVEYEDDVSRGFPGITIRNPVVPDLARVRASLPPGADLDGTGPRKVRLVRRGPSQFAFIAIWYPSVPADADIAAEGWEGCPAFAAPALATCPPKKRVELAFHLSSLIAGIELLRGVWASLAPLIGKGLAPDLLHGSVGRDSPLGHLRALYPLLDFGELEALMAGAVSAHHDRALSARLARQTAKAARGQAVMTDTAEVVGADTRVAKARELLVEIVRRRWRFSVGDDWFDDDEPERYRSRIAPFTWDEYWQVGAELQIAEPVRSIIMDTAIDSAVLKTTQVILARNGRRFIVRAYQPDSEFAEEALEHMAFGAEEVVFNA